MGVPLSLGRGVGGGRGGRALGGCRHPGAPGSRAVGLTYTP
ncbi:hypothetical protein SFR_3491 [Streptomyces sp. FR-008]|nr:hypothetical protein SFR_3491 [Streptomyces sp. FR-008]